MQLVYFVTFKFEFSNAKDRDEAFSLSKNIWEKINQQQYEKNSPPTAQLNKTSTQSLHHNSLVSVLSLQDELPTEDDWNILLKNSKSGNSQFMK